MANFRLLESRETPWRRSTIPHRCDTRKQCRSGDHSLEPESAEALAAGCRDVEHFDVHRVATMFLSEVAKVAPGIAASVSDSNLDIVALGGRSC